MPQFGQLAVKGIPFYAKAAFNFTDHPITIITGKNGHGKSLLFRQLYEFLFGSVVQQDRLKNGSIGLTWSNAQGSYQGIRTLKGGKEKLLIKERLNGTKEFKDTGIRELKVARKFVLDSVGYTEEEFTSLVYLDNTVAHPLVSGNTAQRRAFFSHFFRLNSADDMGSLVLSKLRECEKAQIQYDTLAAELEEVAKEGGASLLELKDKLDTANVVLEKIQDFLDRARGHYESGALLRRYEKRIPALQKLTGTKLESFDSKLASLRTAEGKALANLTIAREQHAAFTAAKRERKRLVGLKKELAALKKPTDGKALATKLKEAENTKAGWDESIHTIKDAIRKLRKAAGSGTVATKCAECGQPLPHSDDAKKQQRLAKKRLESETTNLDSIKEKAAINDRLLKELRAANFQLTADANHRLSLVQQISDIDDTVCSEPPHDIEELETEHKQAQTQEAKLAKYEDVVPDLRKALSLSTKEQTLAERLPEFQDRYEKAVLAKSLLTADIKQVRARKAKEKTLRAQLDKFKQDAADADAYRLLAKAYDKQRGMRKLQIQSICDTMGDIVNKYVPRLFPEDFEFEFKLDKQFEILVTRKVGGKEITSDARMLSGAETTFFSLVLLPTLLAFTPASRRPNILILDEPDANMREDNREALIRFLPILNTVIPHIVFITPHSSILSIAAQEGVEVAHYEAVKKGNVSKLVRKA